MARSKQTQWDFGELFTPEETRHVLTVGELTARVKGALEGQVGEVWVTGEVSNLRQQASGHVYFSLKDDRTQVACVLFRGTRVGQRDLLEDGLKVVLRGELTVYEPRGQYQLIVRALELQGVGELQVRFERLKEKLRAEGLFDSGRKRELPQVAQRMGVVTSLDAAALRDVLHVVRRRQPSLEIVIAPSRVQGSGAERELARGVEQLNRFAEGGELDLILLTRGGGSLEDLWAFNEEALARAVAGSRVPVVSAVGHEVDFTICDFVADVRAATPSAAAEIITAGAVNLGERLSALAGRIARGARRGVAAGHRDVGELGARLLRSHPRRRLQSRMQRVDELTEDLRRGWRVQWRGLAGKWESALDRLRRFRPRAVVAAKADLARGLGRGLRENGAARLADKRLRLEHLADALRLLAPDNVLARGYSITTDSKSGAIIRRASEVKKGQWLRTRVAEGEFGSTAD
ncbi:MAG: exodeoxyribonuclease VII large subunit [Verrucomicrobiales bacterium]|nr:exodeoxyribonuclease VII large subunit [Verrucomicrobiales bacterium]